MQIVADFHLHSRYSRATSPQMNVDSLSKFAKIKGINLLGTGDFTHPRQFAEIKAQLKPNGDGLYEYGGLLWMITGEVSTVYTQNERVRKVHHVIHVPDFEIARQVNDSLGKFGDLSSDGSAFTLANLTSPHLVEILMQISKDILIYPAHAWTPWFGVFGSKSGFDSIFGCYAEMSKYVHALETGLSSDPAMNWRLSVLDDITILSNSDSHSAWPWRLGREANVFDVKPSFSEINDAIMKKDPKRLLFTIEVDPSYGKYHFDGHRACGAKYSPEESKKLNGYCPICRKKLTLGVLHRVNELADRAEGFRPKNAIPFKTLLPLYEIISHVMGIKQLYSKTVVTEQDKIISAFGSELNVLMNADFKSLEKVTHERIAKAIIDVREGKIKVDPGYDGVYGEPVFHEKVESPRKRQKSLGEFSQ